jgi:dolichol-phosphate mannosyltransferase
MTSKMRLSVTMPVYNEEGAIAAAVDEVRRDVLDLVPDSELVVVNDGSKDGSAAVLDRLAADDSRVRVIHQANRGHGGALMAALTAARGEYVFLVDSDRQIPLADFRRAWDEVERGRDGVFGVRRQRHDPTLRLHLTRWVRRGIHALFGVRITDANVPYKLLRRSIWEQARAHIPDGTLAPSLFLAIYVRRFGFDVVELDVSHRERTTGVVSIRRWKLAKFCGRGFRQLLDFRRSLRHAR